MEGGDFVKVLVHPVLAGEGCAVCFVDVVRLEPAGAVARSMVHLFAMQIVSSTSQSCVHAKSFRCLKADSGPALWGKELPAKYASRSCPTGDAHHHRSTHSRKTSQISSMHFNCLHEHPVAEDHVHGADGLQVDGEGVADAPGPQARVEQLRGYEEVPALRGQQEGLHKLLLDQLEVVPVDPPAKGPPLLYREM